MFLEIMSWALLALFLGIVIWDIAIGKPSRFYTIKKGLNTISKVFVALGLLLGFYVCIILTPFILLFFDQNFEGAIYSLTVSQIASYYWVSLILLVPVFLLSKLGSINPFGLSPRELEWEKRKQEQDRRETYETRKKVKEFKDKVFSKFKLRRS